MARRPIFWRIFWRSATIRSLEKWTVLTNAILSSISQMQIVNGMQPYIIGAVRFFT